MNMNNTSSGGESHRYCNKVFCDPLNLEATIYGARTVCLCIREVTGTLYLYCTEQ
ncbi:hypothetical protein RchiOBHm_Chr2g0144371 [Rosa chinensis]|uniref:Uncharacterized protein n=1 Tax=Rosa chinensis TaxID=74649 RepID=A0A2P6RYD1_ROSCH|nr:hypothetical protein RchiOBHm_Chr2g0144371 [Rosa chinensis]